MFCATADAGGPEDVRQSLTRRPALTPAVRFAILRAHEALENPVCQQIFRDFQDSSGRTLQEQLDSLGETGQSHLAAMLFYEGWNSRPCPSSQIFAATTPGSRVVYFCGRKFASMIGRDPSALGVAILHEELHSLGLGENPPTSEEISRRVAQRCN
ncbi:MAG: hypothetical protein ABJC28_01520 [Acidobacteriota bacterium]